MHSTVTKRGQTTIPGSVRAALHIKAGDRLVYSVEGQEVRIRVHPGLAALKGIFSSPLGRGKSFAEIRRIAAENALADRK